MCYKSGSKCWLFAVVLHQFYLLCMLPSLFIHTANALHPGANLGVTNDFATVTWDISGLNVDIESLSVEYSCISPSNTSVQVFRPASSPGFGGNLQITVIMGHVMVLYLSMG